MNNDVAQVLERAAAAQREADERYGPAGTPRGHGGPRTARDAIVRRCYPARPEAVPLSRAAVVRLAAQAALDSRRLGAVALAVSEAVTNAVVHAYAEAPGQIHLTAALTGAELTVLVADDGAGPRTPARTPGRGWGWPLISDCCDTVTISERGTGGTQVELRWTMEDSHDPGGTDPGASGLVAS